MANSFVSTLLSAGIIFGGVIPYVPQYLEIRRGVNPSGFSLYTCLVLIIAYVLRIAFWYGKRFEYPLLIQSFIMISTMILLLEVTTSNISDHKRRYFTDFELAYFWNWTSIYSFLLCIFLIAIVIFFVTYVFRENQYYIEMIGVLSVGIESMLPLPQIIHNFVNASTRGMSVLMVILWTIGDGFKTFYFVYKKVPLQFVIFGVIQIILDQVVLFQVFLYQYYANNES